MLHSTHNPAEWPGPFVRRIGSDMLLARPQGKQYGHLALEILMAAAYARQTGDGLLLIPVGRPVNEALLELESPVVRFTRPGPLWSLVRRSEWRITSYVHRQNLTISRTAFEVRRDIARELGEQAGRVDIPPSVSAALRRMRARVAPPRADPEPEPPYFRRRLIAKPLPVRLRRTAERAALEAAQALGIDLERPIVTVHARESGYKRGREVQDKRGWDRQRRPRDDSTRNAAVENYFKAVDALTARGFTVVRLGDQSMRPVQHHGIVDLATSPVRSAALEILLLLKSQFLITGESGPAAVSLLTNTPSLIVNATDPVSAFPLRDDSMYILKHVVDVDSNRRLRLGELLSEDYLLKLRDTRRYHYEENTPDEIHRAVEEMLTLLAEKPPESPSQRQYHAAIAEMAERLRYKSNYIRKWGIDSGFLGNGRIGSSFAEQSL